MIKPYPAGAIDDDNEDPLADSSELDLSKTSRFTWFVIWVYLFGCLMTNSYCQVYRVSEWNKSLDRPQVNMMTAGATVLWPLYWASVITQEAIKPEQ